MTVKSILERITEIRERERKYSQTYMAQCMGITQKAYSKIETGESRLSVHHLLLITDILQVNLGDILEIGNSTIYNNNATHNGDGNVFNKYVDSQTKDLYEKIIEGKDKEIEFLRGLLEKMNGN